MKWAWYNEIDPIAAAWLRELIADGLIAPGEVDERDVRDVCPDELRSFRQCHFFAGIGGWSLALRRAGWADDRPVWTASCPCQPFSAAGGRGGFADERHLWPAFYHLASQLRPDVVLGEQVASKDGLAWIDLVSSDMEAAAYSGGAVDLCSAGFGAPNIRQRLYFVWMADAGCSGVQCERELGSAHGPAGAAEGAPRQRERGRADARHSSAASRLAYASGQGSSQFGRGRKQPARLAAAGVSCGLASADGGDARAKRLQRGGEHGQRAQDAGDRRSGVPGPVNGFWREADWVLCRDPDGPAWRPVEPSSFPLAPSIPGRLALLRGAGNAINVEVAAGFIECVMEVAQ